MTVASIGPFMGPVVSGCLVQFGWEWPFWFVHLPQDSREGEGWSETNERCRFGLIFAGACAVPMLIFLPETFGPVLLKAKAKKIRKEQPGSNVYAPMELQHMTALQLVTRILGRPLRMMILEPIVSACCCYLSLMYATAFILFQSFSVIYPRESRLFSSDLSNANMPSNLWVRTTQDWTGISSMYVCTESFSL